jgi:hypothetical protein
MLDNVREALTTGECIARGYMPQVDAADIPALLDFLQSRGVSYEVTRVYAPTLRARQRVIVSKVRGIVRSTEPELFNKPVLVGADLIVLDGNHRAAAARIKRTLIAAVIFDRSFRAMVELIFEFPRTYAYGDGKFHPIRN